MIDEEYEVYNKRVKINKAKYVVFTDFCESDLEGYATLEDAQRALELRKMDGGYSGDFEHFIAEIKGSVVVDHDAYRKSVGIDI